MSSSANRSLLFGMLALHNDFIDKHQLVSAFDRWRADKNLSFGEILVELKAISADDAQVLKRLVDRHVEKHAGDEVESLVGTLDYEAAAQIERQVHDADLQESIARVQSLCTQAPEATSSAIGRFRKWKWLGNGGLGVVSMARDEELNRNVALKEIRRERADDSTSQHRFNLEAEVTGGLEHPNIVPVYGFGRGPDGRPYYAMRFIPGEDLKSRLDKLHASGKKPFYTGLEFRKLILSLISVCHALEYAHNRRVVHRDLKPQNIMLGDFGETLVIDWGLAKAKVATERAVNETLPPLEPVTFDHIVETDGIASGTPEYMSPEQAMGRHDLVDARSDVFSLGATLFELLTNRPPYQLPGNFSPQSAEAEDRRNERNAIRLQIAKAAEVPSPRATHPDVPRPLEAICLKAMSKSRQDRYQSAMEMAEDLERWLADEPVTAWKEPFSVRSRRWIQKHRTFVSSLSAAILAALVILAVSVVLLTRANQRAERNFAFSRQTVKDFFETVSEEQLLKQPGMERLRRDMLQKALAYYQEFLPLEDAQKDSITDEMAENLYRVGLIHEQLDDEEAAIKAYERAVSYQTALAEQAVNDPELRADRLRALSTTQNALGRTLLAVPKLDEAGEAFGEALKQREQLTKLEPENPEFSRLLANATMNVGVVAAGQGQLEKSHELQENAQDIRKAALKKSQQPELRRDLAKGHYDLARFTLEKAGKKLQAKEDAAEELALVDQELDQAIDMFQKLQAEKVELDDLNHLLSLCYRLRALSYRGKGDFASSANWFEKAAAASEKMAVSRPAIADYWVDSQRATREAAGDYHRLGDLERTFTLLEQIRANLRFLSRQFPKHESCKKEHETTSAILMTLKKKQETPQPPER